MNKIYSLLILLCFGATFSTVLAANDTIRILCIGNSFSWDAVEQELAPLCEAGKQPIIIGNLYYGGCSLEQHHTFLMKDTAAYSFRYIEHGVRTPNEGYSLRQALKLMKWDYISFQIRTQFRPAFWQKFDIVHKAIRLYENCRPFFRPGA